MTTLEFNYSLLNLKVKLLHFAQSLTSNKEDAEDLLQETIFKALKYKDKYQSETNLKAWMYTIMKNTFINEYRRRSRFRSTQVQEQYDHFIPSIPDTNYQSQIGSITEKDIHTHINRLSDDIRLPFQLYIQGYKYKEISEQMEIPIGTVKSRIFSARKQLSHDLQELHG